MRYRGNNIWPDKRTNVANGQPENNVFADSVGWRMFLFDLGKKISGSTDETREARFLFQRCSVLVQRFNAILLHDSLPNRDCTD